MPSVFLYADTIVDDFDTPSIVGDPDTLWNDADDGTYTQCVGESKAPFDAGFTYRSDRVEGELASLDAAITPTAIIVHLRAALYETSEPGGPLDRAHARLQIRTSDFSLLMDIYDDALSTWANTSVASYSIDLADAIPNSGGFNHYDFNSVTMADLVTALKTADVRLRCFMPNFTSGSVPPGIYYDRFRILEWAIEVVYGAVPKPKRRVYPRDDLNRIYPPPRSMQQGRRSGGSTYF